MVQAVVLCILDGWGYRAAREDNAVALANTPHFDRLWQAGPRAFLLTGGEDVGLPEGQMGNSEVGHMNIGAGRIVYQDLPLIDRALASGELARNPALQKFITDLRASGGAAHVMGLLSPGGVHAHERHILALARILADSGVPVLVHGFLDGRDVPPRAAAESLPIVLRELSAIDEAAKAKGHKGAALATLCGRYFAMDRDKRWERVEKAYDLMVAGRGVEAAGIRSQTKGGADVAAAIAASYAAEVGDEFIEPLVFHGLDGAAYAGMRDGDGILFANFRADRARQILDAFLLDDFTGFERSRRVRFAAACGMVPYSDRLSPRLPALFPPKAIEDGLAAVLARAGVRQMRIAETEKYPHVTYFFNGGIERPVAGEERILVPSPKVATYDLQPEMSAAEVAARAADAIRSRDFGFVLINFANPDMVGHTGNLAAAIAAVAAVDRGLGAIADACASVGARLLVTADHGNCEMMRDPETGGPHTAHTLNPVPVMLAGVEGGALRDGRLADLAPTVLALMEIAPPPAMTGRSLLQAKARHVA